MSKSYDRLKARRRYYHRSFNGREQPTRTEANFTITYSNCPVCHEQQIYKLPSRRERESCHRFGNKPHCHYICLNCMYNSYIVEIPCRRKL